MRGLVCLLKRPALLSFNFQDCSIINYSFYTFGEGVVKQQVKFKTKKKVKRKKEQTCLIDCVSNKKYTFM